MNRQIYKQNLYHDGQKQISKDYITSKTVKMKDEPTTKKDICYFITFSVKYCIVEIKANIVKTVTPVSVRLRE